MENNSITLQNEKEANKFVAMALRVTAVIFTLIFLLNVFGIFDIEKNVMIIAYAIGMVLLLIPTLIVNILKIYHHSLKYIFVGITIAFISELIITLNWHAIVIFIFAIGVANMYYSKRLNLFAIIGSVIVLSASQFIAFKFGFTPDKNQYSTYSVIVFCIMPRALSLIAMSVLFYAMNKRTRMLIANLVDADAQNKVMDKMRLIQDKSKEVSNSLNEALSTLSEVTRNTETNHKQISQKSRSASDGSENTLMQLNEVDENITNISDNLGKLAEGTSDISKISSNVYELTEDNNKKMNEALEGFEKVSRSTSESLEIINDLNQKTKEIEKITEVITAISTQTNLLSLNASIEAARAGEAGKGFSVVAHEISGLADETKNAVNEISGIIKSVTESTLNAVKSMNESSESVSQGKGIIQTAEESSRQVTDASDRMNKKIEEMNSITKNAAEYSRKIVQIVKNVEEISADNVEGLKDVLSSSDKGLSDIEKLEELVREINEMSNKLDEAVHS